MWTHQSVLKYIHSHTIYCECTKRTNESNANNIKWIWLWIGNYEIYVESFQKCKNINIDLLKHPQIKWFLSIASLVWRWWEELASTSDTVLQLKALERMMIWWLFLRSTSEVHSERNKLTSDLAVYSYWFAFAFLFRKRYWETALLSRPITACPVSRLSYASLKKHNLNLLDERNPTINHIPYGFCTIYTLRLVLISLSNWINSFSEMCKRLIWCGRKAFTLRIYLIPSIVYRFRVLKW